MTKIRSSMSEKTISFSNYEDIRTLLGTRDEYLRQVRDSVGVDVVIRNDELRLHGSEEQIKRAVEVFAELRAIIKTKGQLQKAEVQRALTRTANNGHDDNQTSSPSLVPALAADSALADEPPLAASSPIEIFERSKTVLPRTPGQVEYVRTIRENDLIFSSGPAGCGKTFLAVAMAINALRTERVRKIVLVRPAVEAGEKLGFLPGDMLAKVNPYLRPLLDALNDLVGYEQAKRYMDNDVIEVVPLAFMRGRTLNSTFMILDEAQNTTVTQMKMFLTRMGVESKTVVTGDTTQLDLPDNVTCGLIDAVQRLGKVKGVGIVALTGRDIVRHRIVRDIVRAYDRDHPA
jgi:phosphate starvation-inducible PhoH-like protein